MTAGLANLFSGLGTWKRKAGGCAEAAGPQKGTDMLDVQDRAALGNGLSATPVRQFDRRSEKQLRWKIREGNGSERMVITPAMASSMLEWNDRNRPVSTRTVENYAEAMKNGRWHYTGQPVIFSPIRLIDGQHRLMSVVASGVSIDALVVFGAPDEAFGYLDVGKKRTPADVFSINGVKNSTIVAAATSWVLFYDEGKLGYAGKGNGRHDNNQLYDAYLKYEGIQDSVWVGELIKKSKLVPPSLAVALHYLCARKSRRAADEFFRKVADGIGFDGKQDPAYKLYRVLVNDATAGKQFGRKTLAAITIKAWNASRGGRKNVALKFSADETFPRII